MWTSLRSGGWALFSLAWLVGREATKAMNSEKRTLMIQNLDRKRQKENKACWGVSKPRALGNFNKESEGTAWTPLSETWTTMLPPPANVIIMRLKPGKWKTHLKKTWKHMSGWLSLPTGKHLRGTCAASDLAMSKRMLLSPGGMCWFSWWLWVEPLWVVSLALDKALWLACSSHQHCWLEEPWLGNMELMPSGALGKLLGNNGHCGSCCLSCSPFPLPTHRRVSPKRRCH